MYGEGPGTAFDHVLLNKDWAGSVHPRDDVEEMMIRQFWEEEEVGDESRLARCITVKKEHNGLSVFVPDGLPDDCP